MKRIKGLDHLNSMHDGNLKESIALAYGYLVDRINYRLPVMNEKFKIKMENYDNFIYNTYTALWMFKEAWIVFVNFGVIFNTFKMVKLVPLHGIVFKNKLLKERWRLEIVRDYLQDSEA